MKNYVGDGTALTVTAPAAVLDARVLLLFAGSDVTELTPPQATPE